MWVRFPPFPPSRCGREARPRAEAPATHVRFVTAAPKFYAGGRLVARTGDCGSPDVGSTPIPRTILLLRRGWHTNRRGVSGSANCGKVSQGVGLAVSRQSLKLASGVRLAHPLPIGRWRNLAARCALNAEVSGSTPERPAKCLCGYRSGDRIERYERSDRGSIPRTRTIRPSSNGQGAALRMPSFRFDPGWLDQVFMGASGSDAEVMY